MDPSQLFTPSDLTIILNVLGILGILFGVYHFFRNPQIDGDKRDALLSQQIKFFIDGTERRFKEMQDNFNGLLLQSNNHIHTVDTKVDALNTSVIAMGNEITKLSTIIDERIPRK